MIVPNDFYEDEVRAGFLVPSFMKRWWAEELVLLNEIDEVCKKNGLRWFAFAGTLLGAIRDGGFIPWDDDIDICMLRTDYEKLKEIFKSEFPEEYKLRSYENDMMEFHSCLTNGHLIHEGKELEKHNGYPFVTGIDIFPIDFLPDEADKREDLKEKITLIDKAIYYIDDINKGNKTKISKDEYIGIVRKISDEFRRSDLNAANVGLYDLYEMADRLMASVPRGKELTYIRDWTHADGFRFNLECFEKSIEVPFENCRISVPIGYGSILTVRFGQDYMRRVKEKAAHDYPVFEQGMKAWEEEMKSPFFRYVFGSVKKADEERQLAAAPIQRYKELLSILPDYHREIEVGIVEDRVNESLNLLADCQDAAVAIGEELEAYNGVYASVVSLLEDYCKKLYDIYEPLSGGDNEAAKKNLPKIADSYDKLVKNLKENINAKYKIVFLVRRAAEWNSIRELWIEAKNREDCVVYVIPVPYSYIDSAGKVMENRWEIDKFPKEVAVTDYRVIDIPASHPDMIFTQLPYDGYSYSYNTAGLFYSETLYSACQRLIYIPPFITEDYLSDDNRALKMMEYVTVLEGMDISDNILVQSEAIKNIYIEIIKNFDKYFDQNEWREKIISTYSGIINELMPV